MDGQQKDVSASKVCGEAYEWSLMKRRSKFADRKASSMELAGWEGVDAGVVTSPQRVTFCDNVSRKSCGGSLDIILMLGGPVGIVGVVCRVWLGARGGNERGGRG